MGQNFVLRCLYGAVAVVLTASPARAQFMPRVVSEPATGERYHIEASAGFWFPNASMSVSSQSLGIPGTTVDFKNDLGLTDQRFNELALVLRPAKRHKLRFQYIPINYVEGPFNIARTIVFNGQRYDVNVPVNSGLDWKAYRFTYEFDFISRDRGFAGLILDAKYTDVTATLQSPYTSEFARARAPIPALGGIVRYYPASYFSVTGELSGFTLGWLPDSVTKNDQGHYLDLDLYGTLNFTNYVGAQLGYRTFDVGYIVKSDTGSFTLKGLYFGGVVRY
jgi:hypothetical protein